MATVEAEIEVVDIEGDYGIQEGVRACCSRCHHETESAGTSDASIKRSLALLREECPRGEHNFYEGEL